MKSSPAPQPIVTYPALLGRILLQQRELRGIKQGEFAASLGLSQSAYSRLESGDSVLNLSHLRSAALQLQMQPSQILRLADQYEAQLKMQGVQIVSEKQDQSAALAIGLGLLAALFLSSK